MLWIRFQNIHTFTYQKTLPHTFFCLFLKSSKAFSVFLIYYRNIALHLLHYKYLHYRYSQKSLQISPKSDTLIFFSKAAKTIFLVFGLKLVLNMTFNLNKTYFPGKFAIWRYLTSKSSKFGCFLTIRQYSQCVLVSIAI